MENIRGAHVYVLKVLPGDLQKSPPFSFQRSVSWTPNRTKKMFHTHKKHNFLSVHAHKVSNFQVAYISGSLPNNYELEISLLERHFQNYTLLNITSFAIMN